MAKIDDLKNQRLAALKATAGGPPTRTSNQFFGVGPITDATPDEVASRLLRFEFEAWLEKNYRKLMTRGATWGPSPWRKLPAACTGVIRRTNSSPT